MNIQHAAAFPRPDFRRENFCLLDGEWAFAFDDDERGLDERWYAANHPLPMTIQVPFCYQSEKSGIHDETLHEVMWYKRPFTLPESFRNKRTLLKFGAVDYACSVYVNGELVTEHQGGYLPFEADVTRFLHDGENELGLRVEDRPDLGQLRGKQYWKEGWIRCWYVGCSGIWQSVWLEAVGENHLRSIHITPDIDSGRAQIDLALDRAPKTPLTADITVTFHDQPVQHLSTVISTQRTGIGANLLDATIPEDVHFWSPTTPDLYDVHVTLSENNAILDEVDTYFGMRKVGIYNGQVLLNNRFLYQRLVLDQGYWPDTLMTPPSVDALREDVEWTLRLGYNGARKHQKIEDPRYYFWADVLGLLVWGELPAAFEYSIDMVQNLSDAMKGFVERDYNHPSIIAWVPLNESWGVTRIFDNPQMQHAATAMYHLCKGLDPTRIVSTNDGWEQVATDLFTLHDYSAEGDVIRQRFADRRRLERQCNDRRMSCAKGFTPTGNEPFLLTEYGGISFEDGNSGTWGYKGKVANEEAFFQRFADVTNAIREIPYCQGYCYTQLTDVRQEANGLLTPDRKPKASPERLREINRNPDIIPS